MVLRNELLQIKNRADGLTDAAGGVRVPAFLLSNMFTQAKHLNALRRLTILATDIASGVG